MSVRAVVLGLLLGLAISAVTYFNDFVIYQTMLIGNHLPVAVFGTAMALLLVVNPLLGCLRGHWPLSGGELAVVVAIALAACAWPGSGFYRGLGTVTAMPAHWLGVEPAWRGSEIMAYLPGGEPRLAPGHVTDWQALAQRARRQPGADADPAKRIVASEIGDRARELVEADAESLSPSQREALLARLNAELIEAGELVDRLVAERSLPEPARAPLELARRASDRAEAATSGGEADRLRREAEHWRRHAARAALTTIWSDVLVSTPHGQGLLVTGGRAEPAVLDEFFSGSGDFDPAAVPWHAWWPTLRLWAGLALLLALAAIALALIVHPQWSRHELLAYPLARFVTEIAERQPGALLPQIARHRGFWYALLVPVLLHGINGLHAWYGGPWPRIVRVLDFGALRDVMPNAARVYGANAYFEPTIYLTVVAFSFFLASSVSFSLGISQLLFIVLGVAMLGYGTSLDQGYITSDTGNLLRFGAYLGVAAMVLYSGRRYYLQVAGSAMGLGRGGADVPRYSVWAARALALTVVLAVIWTRQAGLDWLLSASLVAMVLLTFLVMSRVVVETGIFFLQAWWLPVGVLTALFGIEAIGPTAYLGLALASVLIVGDPRETLMPYICNGLKMVEGRDNASPGRLAPWLVVMVVTGLLVAGAMTLTLQYQHGVAGTDAWMRYMLPAMPFDEGSRHVGELASIDRLADSMQTHETQRLGSARPEPGALRWTGLGLALVLITAMARLRLTWWPLHPVAFVLWGTNPMIAFAFSFLLGWVIKASVVGLGGMRAHHNVKPIMIGIIAGELLMAMFWMLVGAGYFFHTGLTPVRYRIFPG